MNQREKLLAGGLLAAVGLWQGSVQFQNFVVAPVAERQTEIDSRRERISKKDIEVAKSQAAVRKYKEWKQRSLPPDPINAISLYQNWLVELANKAKLTEISVIAKPSENKSKGDVYALVSADIKAQGKLSQVRDFLYEFRNSALLHRVTRLTLTSKQPTGDPAILLSMTVEGLSLKEATPRSTLFSDPKLAELVKDPAAKPKDAYDVVAKKSLFVRGYNGPPKSTGGGTSRPAEPPDEDPRQFVRLTATFSNGGDFDATLYDPTTNKYTDLSAGSEFKVAGVEGKVVSVSNDSVVLEIKQEKFRLVIGRNLTELEKLPAAAGGAL
ncbi:MAG TPA: hypothetical protein VGM05_28890 [Planctomycetaceae bacterium]|jgi:hypothetical protein